jgi:hypothetical protein
VSTYQQATVTNNTAMDVENVAVRITPTDVSALECKFALEPDGDGLPYYKEADGVWWVKIPLVPASGSTLVHIYADAGLSDESDGPATFCKFCDASNMPSVATTFPGSSTRHDDTFADSTVPAGYSSIREIGPTLKVGDNWYAYQTLVQNTTGKQYVRALKSTDGETWGETSIQTWMGEDSYVYHDDGTWHMWYESKTEESGEAQAGGASTITLAAGTVSENDDFVDMTIELTSGDGIGQTRTITATLAANQVATVDSAWDTQPSAGDDYEIYWVRKTSIGYATSEDGLDFTIQGEALAKGEEGVGDEPDDIDAFDVSSPVVTFEAGPDAQYIMYYEARSGGATNGRMCRASATTLSGPWTKAVAANGESAGAIELPSHDLGNSQGVPDDLIKVGSTWLLTWHGVGTTGGSFRTFAATAPSNIGPFTHIDPNIMVLPSDTYMFEHGSGAFKLWATRFSDTGPHRRYDLYTPMPDTDWNLVNKQGGDATDLGDYDSSYISLVPEEGTEGANNVGIAVQTALDYDFEIIAMHKHESSDRYFCMAFGTGRPLNARGTRGTLDNGYLVKSDNIDDWGLNDVDEDGNETGDLTTFDPTDDDVNSFQARRLQYWRDGTVRLLFNDDVKFTYAGAVKGGTKRVYVSQGRLGTIRSSQVEWAAINPSFDYTVSIDDDPDPPIVAPPTVAEKPGTAAASLPTGVARSSTRAGLSPQAARTTRRNTRFR